MARRSISLLFALLLVLAAAVAAVAVEGDLEAEEVESADEGMPPFLAEDFDIESLPGGIADKWDGDPEDLGDLPYGLAKKLDPCLLPPGQAKKVEDEGSEGSSVEGEVVEEAEGCEGVELEEDGDEGMPPFLAEDYEGELPPGIAAKWDGSDRENVDDLPYGLAKKVNPGNATHPGKGKKSGG